MITITLDSNVFRNQSFLDWLSDDPRPHEKHIFPLIAYIEVLVWYNMASLTRAELDADLNLLKLEIHPDPRYLLPDPVETLKAAEELVKFGFIVLPYVHADPVLCKRLEEAGTAAVMPLGSPIGSNKGLETIGMLEIIIEQSNVPVIVDAGIGSPSDAAKAMEIGADAVLVNTAIAVSSDPVEMGKEFKMAVEAGRMAYEAKLGKTSIKAEATSPLTAFLD